MTETQRLVVSSNALEFRPYERNGQRSPGLTWHPVSENEESGEASYFLRFEPGARSQPHEHVQREEFLVLEGSLVEPDGKVFGPGDFVSFAPGTHHHSHAPEGCLLLVFLRGYNRRLGAEEQ